MIVWKMAIVAAGSALVMAACGSSSGDGGTSACTPKGGTTSGTASQVVKLSPDPNTVGKYDPPTVTVTK
ncbi:MAG TPA: hypothetical protein VK898_06090, partial [Chloroflexota bacterium]|nr:hypothetical protein [Chloroflexota bacterium]